MKKYTSLSSILKMRGRKTFILNRILPVSNLFPILFCLLIISGTAISQASNETMSPAEIRKTAEITAAAFENQYVFAEIGEKIAGLIRKNMLKGAYDSITQGMDLARRLQKDAQSVSQDRHIAIFFAPDRIREAKDPEYQKQREEAARFLGRRENYGFEKIQILAGNIGYLKLNSFWGGKEAFETAVSAMGFLSNCGAVIVDLRWNPGGESSMVQFLSSYFITGDPQLLDVFYFREGTRAEQLWSLPYVPGKKLDQADVYILTSGLTFSAAEGMAYDLKSLKRAVIVGETTMGGAHPVDTVYIQDRFIINMPYAYSRNPITNSNFEGTGVKPDLETERENALATAHRTALENLLKKETDQSALSALKWARDGIPKETLTLDKDIKESYVGSYGPNRILIEKGELIYHFGPGKLRMSPITVDYFSLENFDALRIKIIKENGTVIGIEVIYESGGTQKYEKFDK